MNTTEDSDTQEHRDLLHQITKGFDMAYAAMSRLQCMRLTDDHKVTLKREIQSIEGRINAVKITSL